MSAASRMGGDARGGGLRHVHRVDVPRGAGGDGAAGPDNTSFLYLVCCILVSVLQRVQKLEAHRNTQ